jgi:hypothetical protein
LKNEEPVNDVDNIEEVDNDDWDVKVVSMHVKVKKIKLVSEKVNEKRKNDALLRLLVALSARMWNSFTKRE